MSYDSRCYDLAETFLEDEPTINTEANRAELAQLIQTTIEDHIAWLQAPDVEKTYVCGYASDKGQPGRCTPGDDRCNNYCNMAPAKGPMQPHPARYMGRP